MTDGAVATSDLGPAYEHEDRFAVVLYGGVSLAVYITGVCQELLNMVRATSATRQAVGENSEIAYRLASTIVCDKAAPARSGEPVPSSTDRRCQLEVESLLAGYEAGASKPDADRQGELAKSASSLAPRRRFVVDVLTGSSAGGLNAIYLGKALAHDQSIDHLKDLWVEEGGFSEILNDDTSAREHQRASGGLHQVIEIPTATSLLSGDLMLLKLLHALEKMGPPSEPLVDAIDCYLTTTDLYGLLLPIRLSNNRFVSENRHRSVFHLAFGTRKTSGGDLNHLGMEHDRHLAFIARATSAHPAAFEPAQVKAFADGLQSWLTEREPNATGIDDDGFLAARITPRLRYGDQHRQPIAGRAEDNWWSEHMATRWYSDGGDMDNKPFTYVLHPLSNRRATVPVTRQLLFVEPDPDDLQRSGGGDLPPPLFSETTLGAFNLGRTENIREDIEQVLDRNTTVARLKRGFDDQVGVVAQRAAAKQASTGAATVSDARQAAERWLSTTYRQIIDRSGETELAYEFHKTAWLGGELGELMAKIEGFAQDSAQTRWIADAAQRWAHRRYVPDRLDDALDRPPEHRQFLFSVDLGYRLRRLMFVDKVLGRLQEAAHAGELPELCAKWRLDPDDVQFDEVRALRAALNEVDVDLRCIGRHLRAGTADEAFADRLPQWETDPEWRTRWGDDRLTPSIDESLQFDKKSSRLLEWSSRLGHWNDYLEKLAAGDTSGVEAIEPLDATSQGHLDAIVEEIAAIFRPWFVAASTKARLAIEEQIQHRSSLRSLARTVYDEYYLFDHFVLPSWGEARGELAEAQITRVSPLDATSLVTVSKIPGHRLDKLAGNSLAHFGGFLDADWRRNDVLWGRLDAAEILLDRLLPGQDVAPIRAKLIDLAHDRILAEEWETIRRLPTLSAHQPTVELTSRVDPDTAREFLRNDFSADLSPQGRMGGSLIGRVLDVVGGMVKHHGRAVPERQGKARWPGQFVALIVRTLRLSLPARRSGRNRPNEQYVAAQRIAYAAAFLIGLALTIYGIGWRDWRAGGLALAICVGSVAFLIAVFRSGSVGQSKRVNRIKTVSLILPFAGMALAAWIDFDATAATIAGFAMMFIFTVLSLPLLAVGWAMTRYLGPGERGSTTFWRWMAAVVEVVTRKSRRHRSPDRDDLITSNLTRTEVFDRLAEPTVLLADLAGTSAVISTDQEATPGARFHIVREDPDTDGPTRYRFDVIEVVRDRRLVIRWGRMSDASVDEGRAVVSIHLRDDGRSGTLLHVRSTFHVAEPGEVPGHLRVLWRDQVAHVAGGRIRDPADQLASAGT